MASLNIEWVFLKIYDFFTGYSGFNIGSLSWVKTTIIVILLIVTIIFVYVTVHSARALNKRAKLRKEEFINSIKSLDNNKEEKDNKKWQMILDFITSPTPSDWRIAIIECDSLLDKLTIEKGFIGNNLGERLKNAPKDHFKTLDNAWEAHKLRNRIAHEGMGYDVEYREAKKAIELYESVFKEFDYI